MSLISCLLLLHTLIWWCFLSFWKLPSPSKYAWINPDLNSSGAVNAKFGTTFKEPVLHSARRSWANSLQLNLIVTPGPYSSGYLYTVDFTLNNSAILMVFWIKCSNIFEIHIWFLTIFPSDK